MVEKNANKHDNQNKKKGLSGGKLTWSPLKLQLMTAAE